jgi:hypothetical protein
MGHEPKIYRDEGGDRMVVGSGGKIVVESGGAIESEGTTYVVTEPDDASLEVDATSKKLQIKSQTAIADLALTAAAEYDGTELEAVAAKVDALLAALRAVKVIAEE